MRTTFAAILLFINISSFAQYKPKIAPASNEGALSLKTFQIPKGIKGELFAAEPLLANPACFCIDERGRFFVAETFRQKKGVEDNRSHMNWLHDDLQLQTVEQRVQMFRKFLGPKVADYGKEHDRIRLLYDSNGDGKADTASVFVDGFNEIADGTGAGVLAVDGDVYYTCIPKLWKLTDVDDDGAVDEKSALHDGYGVRVAFRGHDLHGLTLGPDGRIYFSIGDRGYNVKTRDGKHFKRPDTGAVFRCERDGSDLEVFAYGLRNPQELAFDNKGDLFTCDNNSDSGDKARWVHIVEGADIGWRMYFQYLQDRGPWNREKMWHPYHEGQPAQIVPPITNISDGPSGLVFYPGLGLPERYKDHFFLCDFRGGPARSGIRSFAMEPNGATHKLVDSHQFVWKILGTDIDFGYDGSFYITDWVNGWDGLGKGRIYKFTDRESVERDDEAITDAARIMPQDLDEWSVNNLLKLLLHADRRVRFKAQFELAKRADNPLGQRFLADYLELKQPRQSRLHAVWALQQASRKSGSAHEILLKLTADADAEVQAQALKSLGEAKLGGNLTAVLETAVAKSKSENPRVRFFAVQTIGKLLRKIESPPEFAQKAIVELLDANKAADPALRHAGAFALASLDDATLQKVATNSDHSRLGVLLALRRHQSKFVARFLSDPNSTLIVEAARAINDEPIVDALPQLAALADSSIPLDDNSYADSLVRRILNANFRLGDRTNAVRVATIAANLKMPEQLRLEAIEELKQWDKPSPIDRVTGAWRPVSDQRNAGFVADVLKPVLGGILSGSDKIRAAGAALAAKYKIVEVESLLLATLKSDTQSTNARVAALKAIGAVGSKSLDNVIATSMESPIAEIRIEARRQFIERNPAAALENLLEALESKSIVERQAAISQLASLKTSGGDKAIADLLAALIQTPQTVPPEIHLDILEAARVRSTKQLKQLVQRWDEATAQDDPLAKYRIAERGGNADRGAEIFFGRAAASCRRCHKINNAGGEVGPDLTKIGKEKKRDYILESIVNPNAQIAKGFENLIVITNSGRVHNGMIKKQTKDELTLQQADGSLLTLKKTDIDETAKGESAMPKDLLKHLSLKDIRDLVEFLSHQSGRN